MAARDRIRVLTMPARLAAPVEQIVVASTAVVVLPDSHPPSYEQDQDDA
jgi:hypothetical protein